MTDSRQESPPVVRPPALSDQWTRAQKAIIPIITLVVQRRVAEAIARCAGPTTGARCDACLIPDDNRTTVPRRSCSLGDLVAYAHGMPLADRPLAVGERVAFDRTEGAFPDGVSG